MIFHRLNRIWRNLQLNTKLGISFGALLGLIVMVACSGYFLLLFVQAKTKSSLQTSSDIQRKVLEIKAGMERARKMQKDFFLGWTHNDITQGVVSSSKDVARKIQEIKKDSRQLKKLIEESGFNAKFREGRINLEFFLSVAERFSAAFHEATTLRLSLMQISKELDGIERRLLHRLQSKGKPELLSTFWRMRSFTHQYSTTRLRSDMEKAFNANRMLQKAIGGSGDLSNETRKEAVSELESYLGASERMLSLDMSLQSKLDTFDLQMRTVDPIIEDMMRVSDQEMSISKMQIASTTRAAVILLLLALLTAAALTGLIAFILNRSITKNVCLLTSKAKALRQGQLETRIELHNADELGQLAQTFNAMAQQIQKQVGELKKLARTDELTNAANRHFFLQCLDNEIKRVKRTRSSLSLLMFDIDHFKRINDTYGHGTGDDILRELVDVVGADLREIDLLARWGGEEFMVLLPNTKLSDAEVLSERLRKRVAGHEFPVVGHLTVSFGVAQYQRGDSADSFLAHVDKCMYLAKQRGRNTVETC